MVLTSKEFNEKKTKVNDRAETTYVASAPIIKEVKKTYVLHINEWEPGRKRDFDYYIGDQKYPVVNNLITVHNKCEMEYLVKQGFILTKEK